MAWHRAWAGQRSLDLNTNTVININKNTNTQRNGVHRQAWESWHGTRHEQARDHWENNFWIQILIQIQRNRVHYQAKESWEQTYVIVQLIAIDTGQQQDGEHSDIVQSPPPMYHSVRAIPCGALIFLVTFPHMHKMTSKPFAIQSNLQTKNGNVHFCNRVLIL